ncbi:MAG: CBS domain-containing protein [Nitrosopumilus sp.]|nr:CBS domain-containing protein [Nitrosopumilus sp.]MDH3502488.1 CBS domain-containing protein [Nitrosopumilus sp.]
MMSGEGIFVEDTMTKNVVTVEEFTPIRNAAKKMDEANVGSIVVTKNNEPIGIITERDFVRRYAVMGISLSKPVGDIMTLPLITIDPNETVWEAAEVMKTNKIHKLPVIKDKKLVGIITNSDLVKLCSQSSDLEMRQICDEILTRTRE